MFCKRNNMSTAVAQKVVFNVVSDLITGTANKNI